MKNSYPLFSYSLRWEWHSVGKQYLITGYLYLFNEAPDEGLSLCQSTFLEQITKVIDTSRYHLHVSQFNPPVRQKRFKFPLSGLEFSLMWLVHNVKKVVKGVLAGSVKLPVEYSGLAHMATLRYREEVPILAPA